MNPPLTPPQDPPLSRWRWAFYAAGAAMVAFGLWGQLFGADTNPRRYAELLVAAALAHDLLVAPVVLLLGLLSRRVLRGRVRGPVQGAALVALGLVLVAVPGVGRFGERTDNSSVLPRDYGTGLLVALAVVAAGTVLLVVRRLLRR